MLCGDIESNSGPTLLSENLKVCFWNLNGIAAHNYTKLSQLLACNAVYNYDVICLGETFLDSSYLNDYQLLKLPGYQLIRADCLNNTKKGGVAVFYNEILPLKIRNDISPLKECLVCEINVNRKKCFITCLYRSRSQSNVELGEFQDGLDTTFSNLILESPFCSIILGDVNSKCRKWFGDIDDTCSKAEEELI